jgi:GNAT superfamily N-acetyltransferase
MTPFLEHIIWHTLSGPHARFTLGTDEARRYAPGFSPIIGFAHRERPNFAALADYCELGERFYCDGWSGIAPAGWQIEVESTMFKMLWEGEMPSHDEASEAIPLAQEHVPQAMALTALTHPGPFGPRTFELGDYFGCFQDQRLIAMAGERFYAGAFREISGVCTHPDFQGRGVARRLMWKLIRLQMLRGERPFLHVMRDNASAHGLYERMGFRDYHESVVRVVSLR